MTLQEFLSLIVPAGVLVAGKLVDRTNAEGKPYKAFSHATAKSHADLAAILLRMDGEQLNAYFALASYTQGFHQNPTDPTKKQLRVRSNVASLKALWFDIDFKGEYPDVQAAGQALKAFCVAIGLPLPSAIVGSGNGMHVYWAFDQAVPLDRWQRLAEAMKIVAVEKGFAHPEIKPSSVDLGCTADACRVLRPFGTHNWKDPAHPKQVRLLHTSGQTYSYDQLEGILLPWIGSKRTHTALSTVGKNNYHELTGGLTTNQPTANFDQIIKHCGVSRMLADTRGAQAPEPLWTASLQLLKFCTDGAIWVHPISDGHPGYDPGATDRKWQQRLSNTAGPTLCRTFEGYEPQICAKCPHRGHISTPLEVGHEDIQPLDVMPAGWRLAPDNKGIERLMIDDAANTKEWVPVMRHAISNVRSSKSHATRQYVMSFDIALNGTALGNIEYPTALLGNMRKLGESLADYGAPLSDAELKTFKSLMTTWLGKLQAARRVAGGNSQLGWLVDQTTKGDKLVGFSTGDTTYYADGRVQNDIRPAPDFAPIAKHYAPKGGLDQWKKVAAFLAMQNKPAFTAILSAAFATPLLRFTGLSGGILSIVSTASGVGKSSALKCSQAVWGSPTHGVNAVDDTPKSVARKLGYLNNLPAYWDELRGRETVDDFLTLAFQVTQGKERTRLDSSANLREVSTWETMLIVASNESIFEAMGRHGKGSDAGLVRTFEMIVEPFEVKENKASLSILFESLHSNYGHAGRVYAQFLATNADKVHKRVHGLFESLAAKLDMKPQERFWFAIVAILLAGAELAAELDLVKLDMKKLGVYLMANLQRLRQRSLQAMSLSEPIEVIAAFMAQHQDRALTVDRFPTPKQTLSTYNPNISSMPRTDRLAYHIARDEGLLRIACHELISWLEWKKLPVHNLMQRFKRDLGAAERTLVLGAGTKWALPSRRVLEFSMPKLGLLSITVAPSSLAGMSGSHALTELVGSTPPPSHP